MTLMNLRTILVGSAISAAAALGACATPNYNYVPTVENISRPPLGSTNTVGVGEQMLVQGRFEEREALRLEADTRVGALGSYTFTAGHYIRVGGNGQVGFYNQSSVPGSGTVQQSLLADPFQVIEFNPNSRQICGVTVFNLKACTTAVDARIEQISVQSDNSFQQTLIYSGRVGDKINIGYREFSGNLARPAFNNDVEYDLTESNVIGYRGAELEVVNANNREITYRVIRNFNNADR